MAFSEIEINKYKIQLEDFINLRRPPVEIRDQLDIEYSIKDQSIEMFEIRPQFQTKEIIHIPIAKATYIRKENKWKIFWQRADLKWHNYEPKKIVNNLSDFIKVVDTDEYHCFWG